MFLKFGTRRYKLHNRRWPAVFHNDSTTCIPQRLTTRFERLTCQNASTACEAHQEDKSWNRKHCWEKKILYSIFSKLFYSSHILSSHLRLCQKSLVRNGIPASILSGINLLVLHQFVLKRRVFLSSYGKKVQIIKTTLEHTQNALTAVAWSLSVVRINRVYLMPAASNSSYKRGEDVRREWM